MSFDDLRDLHRQALATAAAVSVDDFGRAQTLVLSEDDRAGSAMAVAYHVDAATVIRSDPQLILLLAPLADPSAGLDSATFKARCIELGLLFIDGGDQRIVAPDEIVRHPKPPGARLRNLDAGAAEDHRLIVELLDRCGPDDVDAAEFDPQALDPRIVGLFDEVDGRLLVLASGRPWVADTPFDDIGVLTAESHRGRGWGRFAVSELCDVMVAAGRFPLYRNNWDRPASSALAQSLGFRLVTHLTAVGSSSPDQGYPTTSEV